MNATIYINGQEHRCTEIAAEFFADSKVLPGRRCSHHYIGTSGVVTLRNGGKVKTGGNWYSLTPDEKPEGGTPCRIIFPA